MELYHELLAEILSKQQIQITFPDLFLDSAQIVEGICYRALCQIQAILCNDKLRDDECFQKIEAIVQVFESLGASCGTRHDF